MLCCGKANHSGFCKTSPMAVREFESMGACFKYRYSSGLGRLDRERTSSVVAGHPFVALLTQTWRPCRLDILILLYYTTNTGILHLLKAVLHRAAVTIFFMK